MLSYKYIKAQGGAENLWTRATILDGKVEEGIDDLTPVMA